MYAGHFAIGLALQSRTPRAAAWPLILGVGLLDMLNGLFIILGWDQVRANLAAGPYLFFDLPFIDWDHSLLAAVLWAVAWALLWAPQGRGVALWAALAVLTHIAADWPVHNQDLALFPYASQHVGLALWASLGTLAWWLEGALVVALVGWAWHRARLRGVDWRWPSAAVLLLWLGLTPWFSPMRQIASWPEPWAHLGHGALVALSFVLPGLGLSWLIHRSPPQSPAAGQKTRP